MHITVLDGYTLNPGDLSWSELEAIGECAVFDRTPVDLVPERISDSEIVLTNKAVLSAESINQARKLRYIGVLATGYNVVDVNAAAARGIPVTNVPAYSTDSVAQIVFAHLLNMAQGIAVHGASVRDGDWERSPDFAYWRTPLVELCGKTLGIVGYGEIGRAVAAIAPAFGMAVLVHTRTQREARGVRFVDLETLLRESDAVTLHCPLTPRTEKMIDADALSLMKRTAWLINTGRGPLVDERAVADALASGKLAGFAADVLSSEPPQPGNPLLTAPNCTLSPHIGWATREARERLLACAVENVKAFLDGRPVNVVTG